MKYRLAWCWRLQLVIQMWAGDFFASSPELLVFLWITFIIFIILDSTFFTPGNARGARTPGWCAARTAWFILSAEQRGRSHLRTYTCCPHQSAQKHKFTSCSCNIASILQWMCLPKGTSSESTCKTHGPLFPFPNTFFYTSHFLDIRICILVCCLHTDTHHTVWLLPSEQLFDGSADTELYSGWNDQNYPLESQLLKEVIAALTFSPTLQQKPCQLWFLYTHPLASLHKCCLLQEPAGARWPRAADTLPFHRSLLISLICSLLMCVFWPQAQGARCLLSSPAPRHAHTALRGMSALAQLPCTPWQVLHPSDISSL